MNQRDTISLFHRQKGDELYSRKEFLDAMIAYNKSACFSLSNLNITKKNKSSMKREYLAKSSLDKISMNQNEIKLHHTLKFFKLSNKPHPKVPFIADCVNLVKYEDRFVLIAKIPLKVGHVIAIESSFCNGLAYDSCYEKCSNCMKKVPFGLIPCNNCRNAMFCSAACKVEAMLGFHSYECNIDEISIDGEKISNRHKVALKFLFKALALFGGSVELLYNFIYLTTVCDTIFDFDWTQVDPKIIPSHQHLQLFAACFTKGLIKFSDQEYKRLQLYYFKVLSKYPKINILMFFEHFNTIVDFVIKQYQCVVAVDIKTATLRHIWYGGVYPLRSHMHHSCASNINTSILFGNLVYIVQQPIKQGTMLTINHALDFSEYTRDDRQEMCKINCAYICCCIACVNDFPLWENLKIFENIDLTNDSLDIYERSKNVSVLIEQFRRNCWYIQRNHINFPNKELVYLTQMNIELLKKINYLSEIRIKAF